MGSIVIRHAKAEDLPFIVSVYNQAVAVGFQTADTEPWKPEDKLAWFEEYQHPGYPIFVAVKNETVTGFAVISAYRPGRGALRFTKEISYYLDNSHLREGIGEKLIRHAIHNTPAYGAKTLIAIVLDANKPSISLLQKTGFVQWGHLPNIAEFNGGMCGHFYFGLHL